MNFSTSALSTLPTLARKRPRAQTSMFDLACTSALSSLPSQQSPDCALSPNDLFVTSSPIDNALAALDVGLGLVCSSTMELPMIPNISSAGAKRIPIEQELDLVLAAIRKEHVNHLVVDEVPDDSSCVSGSGSLGQRAVAKVEDSSAPVDVIHELQALDSGTSASVISPPLEKSHYKRQRRR